MNAAVLFTVTALVNALWQPALIAAIAWTTLKLSRCSNATTRHAVWTLALVASAIVPLVSAIPVLAPQATATWQAPHETLSGSATSATRTHRATRETEVPTTAWHAPAKTSSSLPSIPIQRPSFRVQPPIAIVVAIVWALVALVILARLLVSFFYLERLKHDALPLSIEARHELTRYDRAYKGDRDVRICVSDEITVPVAVGIFDAMILIPSDLVHELESNDLDRVLLHELAHVRRSDDWVNLFERVAQALFFFSPGIYWISRQMDLEREVACDDWVLEQSAENVPYARCLARIVEMTKWPYTAPAAPGVFVTRKSMSIRIERLLARGRDIRVRLALVPSLLSLLFIVAVVIAGGFVSPTIAYTLDRTVTASRASEPYTRPEHRSTTWTKYDAEWPSPEPNVVKPSAEAIARATAASTAPVVAKATAPAAAKTAAEEGPRIAATAAAIAVKQAAPIVSSVVTSEVTKAVNGSTNSAFSAFKYAFGVAGDAAAKASSASRGPQTVADQSYLDDLASVGYKHLTPDEVIQMRSLGVDADYIRGLQQAGFSNLTPRELVELKSLGVDGDYVKSMRAAGFTNTTPRELVEMKSLGVDGTYAAQMRAAGITNLQNRDLTQLKALGVDPDYIRGLANAGYNHLSVHDYLQLKALGVDGDYVNSLRNAGVSNLTPHDLTQLKALGVDGDYVKDLASAGYPHLSEHDYEQMKALGVDGAYIRKLQSHGFNNLTVDQIIRYKSLGISLQ